MTEANDRGPASTADQVSSKTLLQGKWRVRRGSSSRRQPLISLSADIGPRAIREEQLGGRGAVVSSRPNEIKRETARGAVAGSGEDARRRRSIRRGTLIARGMKFTRCNARTRSADERSSRGPSANASLPDDATSTTTAAVAATKTRTVSMVEGVKRAGRQGDGHRVRVMY